MSPNEGALGATILEKDLEVETKDRVSKILEKKVQLEKEYEERFGLQQPASTVAAWVELFSQYV